MPPLFTVKMDARIGSWLLASLKRKTAKPRRLMSYALGEVAKLVRDNFRRLNSSRSKYGHKFYITEEGASIPPIIDLLPLHHAAEQLCKNTVTPEELHMLLNPESSLGGAWPKASVKDEQGNLYIAKFSSSQQEYDVVAWEAVALTIATKAGLQVPEFSLKRPARGKSVF